MISLFWNEPNHDQYGHRVQKISTKNMTWLSGLFAKQRHKTWGQSCKPTTWEFTFQGRRLVQMSSSLFMFGFILLGHGFTYFGCNDSPPTLQIQGLSKKMSFTELSTCRVCRFGIPPRFLQRSSVPKSCLAQFRQFSIRQFGTEQWNVLFQIVDKTSSVDCIKLSGAKFSRCQIVRLSTLDDKLSWCQIVRFNCWCQIVRF